MVHYPFLCSN